MNNSPAKMTSRPRVSPTLIPPSARASAPAHIQAAIYRLLVLIREDNRFGTPEEDALRRDFTVT